MDWLAAASAVLQAVSATSFAGSQLENGSSLARVEDYPTLAASRGEQGYSRLAVTVDPSGKVVACAISQSSGSRLLDETGCRIYTRRAKFRPAIIGGERAYGVVMTYTGFIMPSPGTPPKSQPSFDIAIGVSKLPADKQSLSITIDRIVSADGTAGDCRVSIGSGFASYDALACRNAGALPIKSIRDGAGSSVRGVITETILFVVAPSSSTLTKPPVG